jgi:putative transcriptional regulator
MTSFGKELVESATEALAIAVGTLAPAKVVAPNSTNVAAVRKRLGLSQQKFADCFGLNVSILRDWEQGRRYPDQAARTLLAVIDHAPDAVRRALEAA